ncbi:MAG TPA: RNA polymerase sigma factor [Conexibacter sp.]|nr:RNA polymerase sigma factor [Conexibacter sp.]
MTRLDPQALVTHLDRLYRVAWALCGSREEAEDLVQETAVRVLAKPRRLRGQDELAYLVQALRNTFLLSRRTRSRRPQEVATLDQVEPVQRRGSGLPDVALETRELFAAIAALPDDFRHALVAVDVAGLSYREAAELLDTREATIASRVYRGRERVVQALAPGSGRSGVGEASAPARSLR